MKRWQFAERLLGVAPVNLTLGKVVGCSRQNREKPHKSGFRKRKLNKGLNASVIQKNYCNFCKAEVSTNMMII